MKKLLFVLALVALSTACKKKKEPTYEATISGYCQSGKFLFTYNDAGTWHSDTVWTTSVQKTITVREADLPLQHQMRSLLTVPSDSMYIGGVIDGKKAESYFRSTAGPFQISIQLSQAH